MDRNNRELPGRRLLRAIAVDLSDRTRKHEYRSEAKKEFTDDFCFHEVRIPPSQVVLGGELLVPTPEGKVRLKIPPGTQGGQRFRLRERGLLGVSGKRGDLYVVVQINIPKKLTERERELWSELAKLQGA